MAAQASGVGSAQFFRGQGTHLYIEIWGLFAGGDNKHEIQDFVNTYACGCWQLASSKWLVDTQVYMIDATVHACGAMIACKSGLFIVLSRACCPRVARQAPVSLQILR
jgi:hypothetical protein